MAIRQQRNVFDGKVIRVNVETVELPGGAIVEFEIIRHPGGAAVVAIDSRGFVCLLRHYRHAVDDWLWELPAGKLEENEDPLLAATRELEEETGLLADRWAPLGGVVSSPGVFTEIVRLYLATGLHQHPAAPEAGEVFEIAWMPLDEAVERAMSGEIADGKTVAGLCRAQHRLRSAEPGAGAIK